MKDSEQEISVKRVEFLNTYSKTDMRSLNKNFIFVPDKQDGNRCAPPVLNMEYGLSGPYSAKAKVLFVRTSLYLLKGNHGRKPIRLPRSHLHTVQCSEVSSF